MHAHLIYRIFMGKIRGLKKIAISVHASILEKTNSLDISYLLTWLSLEGKHQHKDDIYQHMAKVGIPESQTNKLIEFCKGKGWVVESFFGIMSKIDLSKSAILEIKTSKEAVVSASQKDAIALWDTLLQRVTGLTVTNLWKTDGGKEGKALKSILLKLIEYSDGTKVELVRVFDEFLKTYDSWPRHLQVPELHKIDNNFASIAQGLLNKNNNKKGNIESLARAVENIKL